MIKGWIELIQSPFVGSKKKEFVSVDARYDAKQDPRAYEMLSKDSSAAVTPVSPVKSPNGGRRTPDYFGQTARYHAPARSYSSPRPPTIPSWDAQDSFAQPDRQDVNPLGMNRM